MYVDLPPEGVRTRLLALLYAFWRLEIARLKQLQIGRARPTARKNWSVGFLFWSHCKNNAVGWKPIALRSWQTNEQPNG
jgi:hypothetical protein